MEELSVGKLHRETTSGDEQSEKKLMKSDEFDNFVIGAPSKWQELYNTKIHSDRTDHILEVEDKSSHGFAQSFCALEPDSPRFKIKLLNFDHFKYIAVGLSCKGHRSDKLPGLYEQSVGYDSSGDLIVDKKSKKVGAQWKVGDVIECGIKFPNNFTSNESNVRVKIYFTRNEQLVAETKLLMPGNGYFPTVYMFEGVTGGWWHNGEAVNMLGTSTKVKYF